MSQGRGLLGDGKQCICVCQRDKQQAGPYLPPPRLEGHGLSQQQALDGSPPSTRNFLPWLVRTSNSVIIIIYTQVELSWKWLFSSNIWCVNGRHIYVFFSPSFQLTLNEYFKGCPASPPRTGKLLYDLPLCFHHCTDGFYRVLAWWEGTWATTCEISLLIKSFQYFCLPK